MSEQSKASLGPWEYDESSGAISDSQGRIALLYARDGVQVMHANGQLMAAAWEMAKEREEMLGHRRELADELRRIAISSCYSCSIGRPRDDSGDHGNFVCESKRSWDALAKAGR